MLSNYLKLSWRNIKKYKGFSFLNIAGLAIGLAGCFLIMLWVQDELSFDRFHNDVDNLYRVEEDQYYDGRRYHVNVTPYPVAPGFVEGIPEIVDASRLVYMSGKLIKYEDKQFFENNSRSVDPSFLKMFNFPLLKGDANTALDDPRSVVITREVAEKYFGDDNPLGKVLSVDNMYDFKVSGVLADIPNNSSFQFNVLFPFQYCKDIGRYSESWGSNSIITMVKLNPDADLAEVNRKMTEMVHKNNEDSTTDFLVAPLKKLHLHSYFGFNTAGQGMHTVYTFTAIAMFVLLIACINFMNLSTARSVNRAKEIGVRKTIGSMRSHLIVQFLSESLLMTILSTILAVILIILLLPAFNNITGKEIDLNAFFSWQYISGIVGIMLFTGLIAGSYPAIVLSGFRPVQVLKPGFKTSRKSTFRKILVVFQFILSIFLIIGTITIYNQLQYMQNKKMGFDQDNVLYIDMKGKIRDSYPALRTELLRHSEFPSVSAGSNKPTMMGSNSGGAEWDGKDPEMNILITTVAADYNYLETTGIELLEGREFSKEFPSDMATDSTGSFIINEELARIMGKPSAVNQHFEFMGLNGPIVGVVKDFHYNSARDKIEPMAMAMLPQYFRTILIKVRTDNMKATLAKLEKSWKQVIPDHPCEYHFINEDVENMYRQEMRISELLKYFAIFAILIACLGLFGLASFVAEQRSKEIAVRKVLGAEVMDLAMLMTKEFMLWVILANIIAWPVTYFVMKSVMQNYAYTAGTNWWLYPLALIVTLLSVIVSTGYQSLKTAVVNPVELIRYE